MWRAAAFLPWPPGGPRRPSRAFPELLPYLNAPVIAGNGGLVCDLHTGEIFYRHSLPGQGWSVWWPS